MRACYLMPLHPAKRIREGCMERKQETHMGENLSNLCISFGRGKSLNGDALLSTWRFWRVSRTANFWGIPTLHDYMIIWFSNAKPGLLSSSASRSTSSTQTCKHRFESKTYSDTNMHGQPKPEFSVTCLALGPAGWTHRCQVGCLRPGGLCKSVSDAPNSKQSLHARHRRAKDGGKNLLNKPSSRHTASSFHVPCIHV